MQGQIKGKEGRIVLEEVDVSKKRDAAREYGIRLQGTPTLLVLDAGGRQVKVFVGTPSRADLEKAVSEAMGP